MADLAKTRKPLTVVEKSCYAFGIVGTDVEWIIFGAYSSIFLVEVAQMPPLFATATVFGGRVVDILCNFILAPLIDRTNTRWGKSKPWIVASGVVLIVMSALVWYVPDAGLVGKLSWYIVMYVLLVIAMSGFSIFYRTFVMFLTDDTSDRDSATLYRSIFSVVGIVGGMALHGQILASYRRAEYDPCDNVTYSAYNVTYSAYNVTYSAYNNTNSSVDGASLQMTRTGYMVSSAALCCLLLLSLLAAVFGTTERKDLSSVSGGQSGQHLLKTMKTVLTFRPNVYFLLGYFFTQTTLAIGHGAIALYIQYSIDLEDQIENAILSVMVSSALAVPFSAWVVSKLGKRKTYLCFELAAIPVYIGFQFIPKGSLAVYAVTIGVGLTACIQTYIPWLMITDIIEDCYLQTGERLDTSFVAVFLSINSFAITVGLVMATIGLEIGGYKLGSCIQPETVGSALRILASTVTSVLNAIGVVFVWLYPITEERQKEITETLRKRKHSRDSQLDEARPNGSLSKMNGHALVSEETSRPEELLQEKDKLLSSELDLSVLLDCRESEV